MVKVAKLNPLVLVPSLQRDLQSLLIQQRHGPVCVHVWWGVTNV